MDTPIRSKLFVPGSRPELFPKALASAADAISIDLEDSVSEARKAEARAHVREFLDSDEVKASDKTVVIRVNAPGTEHFERDVLELTRPGVSLINVPKAESAEAIRAVIGLVEKAEAENGVQAPVGILANIETPRGLRRAAEIASADERVVGLQLGLGDLFEPLGIDRSPANVHAAMFQVRMAAAEGNAFVCDSAYANFKDAAGFIDEAERARSLGYAGKSCIHPSQVALANEVFGATSDEVAAAERLLASARAHEAQGVGAFQLDGKMVDRAYLSRAQALVEQAQSQARSGGARSTPAEPPAPAEVDGAASVERPSRPGPLSGIRVLDLSAYIAGPYGCSLLADMGADVIKVEPPGGDNLRQYPSTLEGESRAFLGVNRSKRGIVLDLKTEEGRNVLLKLAETADVLVHNFRPGVPARLGIDFESLQKSHPHLVYCAVSGFGEDGPLKDNAGYDQVLQTMTGITRAQGRRGGPPEIVWGSVVDYYAASMVASGVSAALYERKESGRGQYVGVSLLRSALAMQSARMVWAEGEERDVDRDMRSGGVTGIHPTADGYLYLSANTDHFWKALCRHVGLPELSSDERYDTVKKRAQHADVLVPRLREALARRSAREWEALFGTDVPCAAARDLSEMFDHPQVIENAMVTTMQHPVVGEYRGLTRAIDFRELPKAEPYAAPTLGQHSAEILAEHGFSDTDISRLVERGVLGDLATP